MEKLHSLDHCANICAHPSSSHTVFIWSFGEQFRRDLRNLEQLKAHDDVPCILLYCLFDDFQRLTSDQGFERTKLSLPCPCEDLRVVGLLHALAGGGTRELQYCEAGGYGTSPFWIVFFFVA